MPLCVLNDQDLLGNVTTAVMKADWKFDQLKTKHDLKSFRHTCAINCIKHYMETYRSGLRWVMFSQIEDESELPVYRKETKVRENFSLLRDLIYNSGLSYTQVRIIEMVSNGMRTRDIANECGATVERIVRQRRLAIKKMRAIALSGV